MPALIEVVIPDIGDISAAVVSEIAVAEGAQVTRDTTLVVLESDKTAIEIPASVAGTVHAIGVALGDSVSTGTVVALIAATAPAPASAPAPAPAVPEEAPALIEVAIPDIGDISAAVVSEIAVAEGAQVTRDTTLVVLESDKTAIEIPASVAGTVHAIGVALGDSVSTGTVVALIAATAPASASAPVSAPASTAQPGDDPIAVPPTAASLTGALKIHYARQPQPQPPPGAHLALPPAPALLPYATPEVYRYARQLGVDVAHVSGSGRQQRILREDINNHVKQRLVSTSSESSARPTENRPSASASASVPAVDAARWGAVESRPLPRIKVISGQVLTESWRTIPHVTHHDEADITALETFRKAARASLQAMGEGRLSLLPFITKALALTVRAYPLFNTSLAADGRQLHWRQALHIGIAVDTAEGLVVPVLRDVVQRCVRDIAQQIEALSAKARDGKLRLEEIQDAGITISSLGGIGGVAFTPIINPPQVAILGVSQAKTAAVWDEAARTFTPKRMLPLSLSYDHRVIDGAEAARFMVRLRQILSTEVATLD